MSIASLLIFIVHFFIVLFVILAPFINIPIVLALHINLIGCLILHWYLNSNVCSLSLLESYARGIPSTETFMHRLVSPIYDISECDLNTVIWVSTIVLLLISIYKIHHWYTKIYTKEQHAKLMQILTKKF